MIKRIAAVAAVLALSTTLAFAGPGDGHGRRHGKGKDGFHRRLVQELNLTQDQQRLMADIKKNTRAKYKEFFEASRETMQEARAARKAKDTARLEALKPALEEQRAKIKQIRTEEETQFMSVLTAEQKAQWEQLKEERKARRQSHRNGAHKNRG
jgi:periplasmic protein CpxP/Spy